MAKDKTEKGSTAIATQKSHGNLLDIANAISANFGGDDFDYPPFLRVHGQTGQLVVSPDDVPAPKSPLYLNIYSIVQGASCWEDAGAGKITHTPPVDKKKRYLLQNPHPIDFDNDLEKIDGHKWAPFFEMVLKDKATGQEYTFSASNTSSINAVRALTKKVFSGAHDLATEVPLIRVEVDSFMSKAGNKVHKPQLVVDSWVPVTDVPDFEAPVEESDV